MPDFDEQLVNDYINIVRLNRDLTSILKEAKTRCLSLLMGVSDSKSFTILQNFLYSNLYFEAPASIKHHLATKGGLMIHSLSVYSVFKKLCSDYHLDVPEDVQIKSALLHDLCKIRTNVFVEDKWTYVNVKGHAELTLSLLDNIYYPIDVRTRSIIQYHMGIYSTEEFGGYYAEHPLSSFSGAINTDFSVFVFHVSDMLSSHCIETV